LNKDQALVPSKCEVLFNKFGTAPGMWIQKGNTIFISLPGVPFEMKNIIESEVIPRVVERFKRPYIVHKTILTYGVGESLLAERIENWENNLPDFIKLAYLPSPGRVRLRLSARGKDNNLLQKSLDDETAKLTRLIGDAIVGFEEDETLEVILGRQLNNVGKTIATAESCTGGKIAQVISSIAGASNYFKGSIVSYSTQSKIDVLKVSSEIIKAHSVVSAEVAIEMAKQAQLIFQSDYAIATTGNAGPTKGDADAEIGTVFIALATPNSVIVEEFNFGQPREKVIDRAVNKALEMARKEILKNV